MHQRNYQNFVERQKQQKSKGVSVAQTNKADLSEGDSLYYNGNEVVEMLFKVSEKHLKCTGYLYITSYKMKLVPDGRVDTGFGTIPYGYVHTITEQ